MRHQDYPKCCSLGILSNFSRGAVSFGGAYDTPEVHSPKEMAQRIVVKAGGYDGHSPDPCCHLWLIRTSSKKFQAILNG